MTAEELMGRFSMEKHIENGAFTERHYAHNGAGRPASGSIYYYVAPGEATQFHRIDCDEYWCFNLGSPLEVWQLAPDGALTVTTLGADADCEPLVYISRGTVFAARNRAGGTEGTFLTCITVPRFSYDGFELISEDDMRAIFPASARFFE